MRIIAMLSMTAMLTGCAGFMPGLNWHPPEDKPLTLDPGAKGVRVAKSDPPIDYEEVSTIKAFDGEGCGLGGYRGDFERMMIKLKNEAHSKGADYVQILSLGQPYGDGGCYHNEYSITGIAYKKK